MKRSEEYVTTTNRSVYNKIHKMIHASCDRCQWHRGCNRYNYHNRSWKSYRKTQYKIK